MRKIICALAALALLTSSALSIAACGKGENGLNGKSAYEIAVEHGFKGTEEEWLESLKGSDGVSVETAYIDADGNLIVKLTDGREINCGKVTGGAGETEGLAYSEVKDGEAVTGYLVKGIGTAADSVINIPSEIGGLPVVGIDEEAFSGCDFIYSVVIPDSVTTVGNKAFYECSRLKSVSFGSGVRALGEVAFGRCVSLKDVNIKNLKGWCEASFTDAASSPMYFAENIYLDGVLLTDAVISDDTEKVADYAFYGCNSLESADTGGAASVGNSAFYGCANLKSVKTGAAEIGDSAFGDCEQLSGVTLKSGVNSIGEYAFMRCAALEELDVPASVDSIGEGAFSECMSLKTVNLKDGLKFIGECAFVGCTSLEAFIMPDSVTEIGMGILMAGGGGGFGGAGAPIEIKELVISNALKDIPDFAFNGCTMEEVTIGSSVENISYSAFFGCGMLKKVIIPTSVKKIVSYAFYRCEGIEDVFFAGSAEEWANVSVSSKGNDNFTAATVYFYSETAPAGEGNFWRYESGAPVKW